MERLQNAIKTLEHAATKHQADLEAKEKAADVYLHGYQELLEKVRVLSVRRVCC